MVYETCKKKKGIWVEKENGSIDYVEMVCNLHVGNLCRYYDEKSGSLIVFNLRPGSSEVDKNGCVREH